MMMAQGCDAYVVTALDEVAWLLNIRGRDTPYSPVLRAYLVITEAQISLYVPAGKLSDEVKLQLRTDNCYSPHCARSVGHHRESLVGLYSLMLITVTSKNIKSSLQKSYFYQFFFYIFQANSAIISGVTAGPAGPAVRGGEARA